MKNKLLALVLVAWPIITALAVLYVNLGIEPVICLFKVIAAIVLIFGALMSLILGVSILSGDEIGSGWD